MQKTVIINRGIPASGKSTLAKEIVKVFTKHNLKAIICSTDDFFMQNDRYIFDQTKLRENHLKNQDYFFQALEQGKDLIICDNTNIEPWEAKPYYNMAKKFNYNVLLLDIKPRELLSHIEAQSNKGYNHNIPQDIIVSIYARYQTYSQLTSKSSYPTREQVKKDYNEISKKVEEIDELSELFYYDNLITIESKEFHKIKQIIGNMILKKVRNYDLDEIKLIPKKYKIIMKEFEKRADKTLTAYDIVIPNKREYKNKKGELIQSEQVSIRQIERYFKDLMSEFSNIIEIKKSRQNAYKLIDTFEIFTEAFKNFDEIDELFYLAKKSNPELFKKLDFQMSKDNDIYLFQNYIFETIKDRNIFNKLKTAIELHEYRDIKFDDETDSRIVKPIKFVFVDNNWYLAFVNSKDILKLGRINFIKQVEYSDKVTYQKSTIQKHLNSLKQNLQNSNTTFNVEQKTATIKATPLIAKYFKEDMKKFLSTQKFKENLDDGGVIFTLKYTQPLEILPFIQRWLPDLIILEPQELKDEFKQKLQKALDT